MSSLNVRSAFEAAWAILLPNLTLYATINEEPDRNAMPDQWATVDYLPAGDPPISLGNPGCFREAGVILVVAFVLSGQGDTQAVTLADQIRDTFRNWKDPTGAIKINEAAPPESDAASDGRWFAASISLTYQYDRYL